jgi:prepilin-type N-terminal cleavage/methylation domain-containing protein
MKNFFHKSGFTLVETIMVVSIYTILLLVISTSIYNLYQANGYTIEQSYEIDHARRGLQTWLKDAREMTYADDGTFPIAVIEPHRVGFYSDIDSEPSVEYVEYVMATTTLYKNIYKAAGSPPVYNLVTPYRVETLSEYVQNLTQSTSTFMYLDTNGVQLTATSSLLTDVRYLEARVIVNIDPLKSPGEFLLRSGVAPRNLKDNL